jgi:regulatory protein
VKEKESPDTTPRQAALRRLNVREHSAAEITTYLVRKGFNEAEAREAVALLVEEGLISDERYKRAISRHHTMRGKGPRYIQSKLAEKGVRAELRDLKDLYAEQTPGGELQSARTIVENRYPEALTGEGALKLRERGRAFQALLRRGFSFEVARASLEPRKD